MDLEVGSNLYRNTDGTIEVEGVPLIQVAQHPSTGSILLNFALVRPDRSNARETGG